MKGKARGFTVLELIITLAITTMVLGVIYTFFFTSNKTLSATEIRSTLQSEAIAIENTLLNLGTQCNGILEINNKESDKVSYGELQVVSEEKENYKMQLNNLELNYENEIKSITEISNGIITTKALDKDGDIIKDIVTLSKNVKSIKVRPIDIRMVSDIGNYYFDKCPGLQFDIVLAMKKGYSDVEYPLSVLVKFRNK